MIGKICPRGRRPHGLLRYLYATGPAQQEGRGGRNPHVDPRLIGAWDDPADLEPTVDATGRRDFRRLAALLEQPLAAAGVGPEKRPVYHLVIAARKDPDSGKLVDRLLTDGEWADVAGEYLHRLGLAPRGDDLGVRWVAVRHADDHVHVVATLARQDGRRVFPRNDFYRSGEASRFIEAKYGLTVTAGSDRTAAKRPTRAEARKAERQGGGEPVRNRLRRSVRSAAAGAGSLPEFLERLRDDGLLVRERLSERNPGEVTGYAVALPELLDSAGKPVYFGGGKLAADLALPQLRRRWQPATRPPGDPATASRSASASGERLSAGPDEPRRPSSAGEGSDRHRLTPQERDRIWVQATAAAARATEQITSSGAADPGAAGDAAWAGSDFLAAAARVVEGRRGGPLTVAAESYDRAARELWGRTPAPTNAGAGLRAAGVLLASARFVGRDETRRLLALLAQLAALSDAVTRLRETQDRAAQAAAARRTAEQLRATVTERTAALAAAGARGRTATAPPPAARRPGPVQPPPGTTRRGPQR